VESLGRFPDSWLAEIAEQPRALRRAAEGIAVGQRAAIVRFADAARTRRRIAFSGMGASYVAGYVPVADLAANGISALHEDAAELLHFRLPVVGGDTTVVLISQSGESAETVALGERALQRPPGERPLLVSVTNGLSNRLADMADIAFDTLAGPERGPSTLTFGASLVVLTAMARAILGEVAGADGGADDFVEGVDAAARAAERILTEDPTDPADGYAAWLADRPMVVTLARGRSRAAAEMAALLLKEAARFPAEAMEAGQFRHGPVELAGPGLAAFIVATEPSTHTLDRALAADLAASGAAVMLATNGEAVTPGSEREDGDGSPAWVHVVSLGSSVPASLAPAVAVIPMQLVAWRLSVDRDLDPMELRVATKVTTHE
jgi:glucosamine--fructose-6-phosphate aminotransferase (isomerizing)